MQDSLTRFVQQTAAGFDVLMNGMVRTYVFGVLAGVLLVVIWFLGVKG